MSEIPIDKPSCAPWISRATDRLIEATQGGERTTDIDEIDHAIRFFGMLEIDSGLADPEVRITHNGRIVCMWARGRERLVVLIRKPADTLKDRRYMCYARYIFKAHNFYEEMSTVCYPVQIRDALAKLYPTIKERWDLP